MTSSADGAAPPVSATHLARLLQFGDSMLPIGGFSFSGGLESAIQKRVVTDTASLLAFARKLSDETRTMSVRMGRKFAELGAQVTGSPALLDWRDRVLAGATPGCYPVALALNFAAQGLPARDAFVVHQYGVASMILSAALRLMKISHVDTQRILYRLDAGADAAYEAAASARLEDMAGFAPLAEILAAVHVKAHVRLFMN